jgi:hypothetical protein
LETNSNSATVDTTTELPYTTIVTTGLSTEVKKAEFESTLIVAFKLLDDVVFSMEMSDEDATEDVDDEDDKEDVDERVEWVEESR